MRTEVYSIDSTNAIIEFSFAGLQREILRWQKRFPLVAQQPIGTSVLGQPLHLFKIGSGDVHIHLSAAMHANEWLTAYALVEYGMLLSERWDFCLSGKMDDHKSGRWKSFFSTFSVWVTPLVNPDGVQLVMDGHLDDIERYIAVLAMNNRSFEFAGWKANIRGVDLNDQFPAGWELERERRSKEMEVCGEKYAPGPRDFCGEKPLSEPEAVALVSLAEQQSFAMVIAFHSQGEEIYYNYCDLEPTISMKMATRMELASGYRAVKLSDSDAGFKDWFIQQFGRPGFTVELGSGANPLPVDQLASMSEKIERIVTAVTESWTTFCAE
jgi:g-D-glutamyl-meso-diaminopimelate peptidase